MLLASCTSATRELPDEITCTVQYRPDASSNIGTETSQLLLPLVGNSTPAVREELVLGTFLLSGSYVGEAPDGRGVSLAVTDREGQLLTRMLYQLEDAASLQSRFAGGHGFTGLHYARSGDAELQIFCTAEG